MAVDLQKILTQREVKELRSSLKTRGGMPFAQAHGLLTATLSGPELVMPSTIYPVILPDPNFADIGEAESFLGLWTRLSNQILTELGSDELFMPYGYPGPRSTRSWCQGYLQAADMSGGWPEADNGMVEDVDMALFDILTLSGKVDLTGETDSHGNRIDDPVPFLEAALIRLPTAAQFIFDYWFDLRSSEAQSLPRPVSVLPTAKIGRNQPCPCGSGKKYKRCCGSPSRSRG